LSERDELHKVDADVRPEIRKPKSAIKLEFPAMPDLPASRAPQAAVHCVVMAGGGGTRFWPRSRRKRPKQFLNLAGARSLLQQALERLAPLAPPEHTWVIGAAGQADLVRAQLPELPAAQLVAEPLGRDTAAAIGLGAALIHRQHPDAVMVVVPADHVIEPAALYQRTLHAAIELAREHPKALITIGIPPTFPATGYGYIHRGHAIPGRGGLAAYQSKGFKEKPRLELATQYLRGGDYYWNSGIFIWTLPAVRAEFQMQHPSLLAALDRIAAAWDAPQRDEVFRKEYEALKKVSIDYAIMEMATDVIVLEATFTWDDVGSWLALERHHPQDAAGNTIIDTAHLGLATKSCLVVGDGPGAQLIATVGVENLLIVRDGACILVADKRNEADVKQLVELLQEKGLERFA
jgi:mannose-1-phosphate guanylyltransferase